MTDSLDDAPTLSPLQPSPPRDPVTTRLKHLRVRAGLTMGDVARALSLKGPSSYQHYEDWTLCKKPLLPVHMVSLLEPLFVGRGEPPISSDEVWALAGIRKSDIASTIDRFLDDLPEAKPDPRPIGLLAEIELIHDPAVLEAAKKVIDWRIAWLKG